MKELLAAVAAAFIANPTADVLLATNDGNCFLEKSKNAAELHARQTNQKIKTFNREDLKEQIEAVLALKNAPAKPSKKEIAEAAKKAELATRAIAVGLTENATEEEVIAAEEAKEKAELVARAIAVGLPEDATEKQIIAAEKKATK